MPRYQILCLLIFTAIVAGCSPKQQAGPVAVPPPPVPFAISDVRLDRNLFHPTDKESITITFRISRPAKPIIQVFDREEHLVQDLYPVKAAMPETYQVVWDGKDLEGALVPDGAYFFTIEAMDYKGNFTYYDPTTFSGGEYQPIPVEYHAEQGVVQYELTQASLVSIRAGVTRGPLLKTIANWEARQAGLNREAWDGMDAAGQIPATGSKGMQLVGEAVSLPENSVIVRGNSGYSYFEYLGEMELERPKKKDRPKTKKADLVVPLLPTPDTRPGVTPNFRLQLSEDFQKTSTGLPILSGKVGVKVFLDEEVKRYATEHRYEVICFVDFQFVTEKEEGYSPSTWVFDTTKIHDGEHILTVNVATLNNQRASASMKVMVEN